MLRCQAIACAVVLVTIPAAAQELSPPYAQCQGTHETTGDTPLLPLETFAGNVDVFVDIVPQAGVASTSGSFTVSGIPAGATILRAWMQVTEFDDVVGNLVSLTFDGHGLAAQAPTVDDPGYLVCGMYRFDVTAFVTGNGNYPYAAIGNCNAWGDSLVVVYEHGSLPPKTIAINDGSENLLLATSTTTFAGLPAAAGELLLFTQADNASGVETVELNGNVVAGPADLFAANNGYYASLVSIGVTSVAGLNTVSLTTSNDHFGYHLAILCIDAVAECFLIVGDSPGDAGFLQLSHLFQTQVDQIEDSYPVLMDAIPDFVLPGTTLTERRSGLSGFGSLDGPLAGASVPRWMADGDFVVQVVMWNPGAFPGQPEQYTAGLHVTVLPGGAVITTPYGANLGGMQIMHEIDVGADGQRVIRFPFSIPGF